jgi:hypothetical protein
MQMLSRTFDLSLSLFPLGQTSHHQQIKFFGWVVISKSYQKPTHKVNNFK